MAKTNRKKKDKAVRRGERVGTFAKLGRATPTGIGQFMQGATAARGVFVPISPRPKKTKKKKRLARNRG